MKMINYLRVGCILILALTIDVVQPTCVLDSDFGFKINCAFKKAGLFRVRNLGGVKAHASIGFSLGDELGFEQSLTNLDPSRRRSVNIKNGSPVYQLTESTSKPDGKQEKRGKQNRIMMRPPPPTNTRMHPSAVERLNSLHRRASTSMPPIIVSDATLTRVTPTSQYTMGVPPFKPLPPKEETLKVLPISTTRKTYSPLPIPQSKGPGIAYQSEKIRNYDTTIRTITQPFKSGLYRITPSPIDNTQFQIHTTLHPFLPMPQALKIIPGPIFKDSVQLPLAPDMRTKTPTAYSFTQNTVAIHRPDPISNFVDPVPQQVHQIANQNYPYGTKKVDDYNTITGYNDDTALKINKEDINDKIAEIAKQGNISMEAVEAAIALRQQQLLSKYANIQFPTTTSSTTTTTTTTTTTPRTLAPVLFEPDPTPEEIIVPQTPKPKRQPTIGKVMNAPKEYYPVGYEKNFDDHFQSKVDLPDTDFHCGDQKYFPGLYGDENLGCMVFHVCALTDDGLVMKSFLCPESTLFDQTILKCNWWFYVDCKSTRRLYDTNIPVSKSYQLMKALTFFSSYNKDNAEDIAQNANPEDMDGVKQAISILENHDKTPSTIHIVTPQPAVNNEAPVYRGNRNMRNSTTIKIIQNDMKTSSSEIKTDVRNSSTIKQSKSQTEVKAENKTSAEKTNSSENNSKERQYRRRQMWNKSKSKNNVTTTTTTTPKEEIKEISQEPNISSTEANKIKQMILLDEEKQRKKVLEEQMKIIAERNKFVEEQNKVVKLTDQIETANETISQEVIRVSRSSAEIDKDGDHKIGNHKVREEKVFIVRPTLVGEVSTPTAAIEKLDEAILGRRRKKQIPILNVVTPEIQESRT